MEDFFQEHPNSKLKEDYPQIHRTAMATGQYKELEELRAKGLIDEIDYQLQLDRILPLIDISKDVYK